MKSAVAEGVLGGGDARGQFLGRGVDVALGKRCLQAEHVGGSSSGGCPGAGRWRQPGLLHGDGGLRAGYDADSRRRGRQCMGRHRPYHHLRGATSPDRHDPRRARLLPVQGRRRPGDLRRQGGQPPPAPLQLLPDPAQPPPPHRPDGGHGGESVEWIQVRNEVEALMLEYSLIKQHRPRFNIRLRDDKSYPFLAVTLDEEWPRAMVMRGRKRKGVRYFGPYGHAYAIRETLDLLLRTFPIRTCSPQQVRPAPAPRPALPAVPHREVLGARASARSTSDHYDELVEELLDFLDGDTDDDRQAPRARDARGRRRARVRAGGPAAATGSAPCARPSSASRWWPSATRTST